MTDFCSHWKIELKVVLIIHYFQETVAPHTTIALYVKFRHNEWAMTGNLKNKLLISMPQLGDELFEQAVVLVCEHSEEGAMGIIINIPLDIKVQEVLQQLDIDPCIGMPVTQAVLAGGPVHQERGFVMHKPMGHWQATLTVGDGVGVTTSRDILEEMAAGRGPEQHLIALGYSGWDSGQLENEIAHHGWLVAPVCEKIIFEVPYTKRWHMAAASIGIDTRYISAEVGHA